MCIYVERDMVIIHYVANREGTVVENGEGNTREKIKGRMNGGKIQSERERNGFRKSKRDREEPSEER